MMRKLLFLFGIAWIIFSCNRKKPDDLPNIVFIMADDMGYGDVSVYYPDSRIQTPNIDRLASEGILFTDAHTPAALSSPTRYGLLTGRYAWRTRLKDFVLVGYDETPLIEEGRTTLASLLKKQNYSTACIGKWHLGLEWPTKDGYILQDDKNKWQGYPDAFKENEQNIDFSKSIGGGPVDLGFDYFFGTSGCSTSDSPYAFIKNDRTVGIPSVMSTDSLNKLPGFLPGLMVPDWSEEDVDPIFTEKAISFINKHQKSSPGKPFFLYLAFSSPHIPWLAPDFIKDKSQEGPRGDLCALVDWCVGKILDELDKQNLSDNTLLIFTSDNGPRKGANGHKSAGDFRGYKASIWEGGHRVPFIARWPGKIKSGTKSNEIISLTDMLASFSALTNSELTDKEAEDSYNVLPAILGEEFVQPENRVRIFHSGKNDYAIRQGKWKLVTKVQWSGLENNEAILSSDIQLFNLQVDPYEKVDISDNHAEIIDRLKKLLQEKILQKNNK
ncbi:arylsulfatase [Bacteroidota bacterium]